MTARVFVIGCFVAVSGVQAMAQIAPLEIPRRSLQAQPRASVICGTRIFQADPTIDPKIAKTPPPGVFTLRTVQPPVCRDAFPTPLAELKQRLPQIFGPKK